MKTDKFRTTILQKNLVHIIFFFITLLSSYYFMQSRFINNFNGPVQKQLSEKIIYDRHPFASRFLSPMIINKIIDLTGNPLRVYKLYEFTSVFLLTLLFRYFLNLLIGNISISSLFALLIILVMPFNHILPIMNDFWYPYDIPAEIFMLLGIICIYKKKMILFYLVFIIGLLNRESIAFLACLYLLTEIKKENYKSVLLNTAALAGVWIIVKLIIYAILPDYPTEFDTDSSSSFSSLYYCYVFFENIKNLFASGNLKYYFQLFGTFGFLWIPALIYYRRINNNFIQRALLIVIPFAFFKLNVGWVFEIRSYGELTPIILSAYILILINTVRLYLPQD